MTIRVKSTFCFASKILAWATIVALAGKPLPAQTIVWSGNDATNNVNTNWSDANNWTGGTPGPATNICFFNPGANGTQDVVNNIVAGNTTILSLQYGNTNNYHTTLINPGVTLTVSNTAAANLVFVGTGTDNGASQMVDATVTGTGGHLVVTGTNSGSVVIIQQGSANSGTHNATLNLAGLDTFNLTAGRLLVGGAAGSSINASNWCSGTLILAKTNVIQLNGATAPALDEGDAVNNGATQLLQLGQTNVLFIDTVTIAHSKATATLQFNPAFAGGNPVLYLRGNTNAQVNALAIGDFSPQTTSASTTTGTVNLTGGTVNALVNTCSVGIGQTGSGAGTSTGTLILGAGVFNVNTLNVGYVSVNTAAGNVTGAVNVSNGTLVVNTSLVLGYNPGATATASGALSITNGGSVLANAITTSPSGAASSINLTNGTLVVSNTMGLAGSPVSFLRVYSNSTLQFSISNSVAVAQVKSLSSDGTGVINIRSFPNVTNYPSQPIPILSYQSGGGSVTFSAGTLPGGYTGYISNDNSSTIWLVVTNGPAIASLQWGGGVNNLWDTNTLNWTNNGVAVAYHENNLVVFNDSAQTATVNLVGTEPHTPFGWTVTNNVLNYTFTGTNSISGSVGLNKFGSGSLTLSERGDSFSGGITVNGGTVILDQAASAISGGLSIGSGATAQIGKNDTNGALPAGAVSDGGALVFSQTMTDLVATAISGGGSLTQNGGGKLELSGVNTYFGNTFVLQGTLALTGSGAISNSANVAISNAKLDVSGAAAATVLGNLNMTNGVVNVGATTMNVAGLNMGGSSNIIDVAALPGVLFTYPTNFTLIQSVTAINGFNFVLGSLPAQNPSYAGSVSKSGNAVVLTLTAGPPGLVQATVSFSTNAGVVLNPAFCGLSYEKGELTGDLFVSTDTALIKMFGQIGPAILRVGGNSVNTTCWGGISNQTPITAAEVDAFAGFVKALPTNWHVIYGINMSVNSPSNGAAEAAYAANALGSSLLGFEIGNEPDLYYENGIRATNFTYAQFLSQWQTFALAISNAVPGSVLTGPASAGNTEGYTVPFAGNEAGVISMVTQHYYRANGQSPSSTLALLLQPDTSLPGTVSDIAAAASAAKLPLGFRMDECGSFYNGGAPNVSDAYGAALWTLDFMFTCAINGCQGVNFHGGGDGTGYTPIADNGTTVVQARPEFYGLKMFSLLPQGSAISPGLMLGSKINFTAYGVRQANGGIAALLDNKETNDQVEVAINLGPDVTAAQMIELTGTALDSTNGYTIGGAEINANGSWTGGVQSVIPATNGQLTVIVPTISAVLLIPVIHGTNIAFSVAGNQLRLNWPTNYTGWTLQSNSTGLAASNAWFAVAGSPTTNSVQITINAGMTNVFYRMVNP
jgi:autotransporter-associated beta strand protein